MISSSFFLLGRRVGFLLGVLALTMTASAFDLQGTYVDKGTGSTVGQADTHPVSLWAIVTAEPLAPPEKFAEVASVRFRDHGMGIDALMRNAEGKTLSHLKWQAEKHYAKDDDKVTVWMKGLDGSDDGYAVEFNGAPQEGLLEVTVTKVLSTQIGPKTERLGVYYFEKVR